MSLSKRARNLADKIADKLASIVGGDIEKLGAYIRDNDTENREAYDDIVMHLEMAVEKLDRFTEEEQE